MNRETTKKTFFFYNKLVYILNSKSKWVGHNIQTNSNTVSAKATAAITQQLPSHHQIKLYNLDLIRTRSTHIGPKLR